MISIAYQAEFTNCKRVLSIFAGVGGSACVRITNTGTQDVIKEVSDVDTEDALELYEELYDLYTRCENCAKSCCIL